MCIYIYICIIQISTNTQNQKEKHSFPCRLQYNWNTYPNRATINGDSCIGLAKYVLLDLNVRNLFIYASCEKYLSYNDNDDDADDDDVFVANE